MPYDFRAEAAAHDEWVRRKANGPVPSGMSLAEFLKQAKDPEFLIDRMLQRGFLYTLTALTFHGKTSTMIYLAVCVALGRTFAGYHTYQGRVVILAGENPDDTAAKFRVACDFWGLNPDDLPITIIPGAFDLSSNIDAARAEIANGCPVALIGVDTSAAYRFDDDEDDNQTSKIWGQTLRTLTILEGKPAVIVPIHPTKYAERNSLLPRGGSGLLNEIDGNLSLWADLDAATTQLHWQGKLRGPSFNPISLDMRKHPHPTWRAYDGKPIDMVAVVPSATPTPGPRKPKGPPPVELPKWLGRWHDALLNALVNSPTPGKTTKDAWLSECVRIGLTTHIEAGDSKTARESKRNRFRAAVSRLVAARWVGADGETVCNLHVSTESCEP